MKSVRIEVSDEMYDRYIKNREKVSEEMAKIDLAFLADAFLNCTLLPEYNKVTESSSLLDAVEAYNPTQIA